jgi:hypothetical protein
MEQIPTRAGRRRRPAQPMPSLDDAAFVTRAFLAGLRGDPFPPMEKPADEPVPPLRRRPRARRTH